MTNITDGKWPTLSLAQGPRANSPSRVVITLELIGSIPDRTDIVLPVLSISEGTRTKQTETIMLTSGKVSMRPGD